MLITEAPMTSARHREQLAQLVFEKLRVPALHVAPCPTLALYGSGRTTGVVLDVGDTVMSATPIYEGVWHAPRGAGRRSGGRAL
jgi:actin-related protein